MSFIEDLNTENLPKINIWINEAKFGFSYLTDPLEKLKDGDKILEVGCGSGLLMGLVKERFPHLTLEGIEPFGDGFSQLENFQKNPIVRDLNIIKTNYEDFIPSHKYDIIYLVNVFEHMIDWRDFIDFAVKNLNDTGRCVVLCPNYGFPYESHFRLPVIFSKNFTQSVFKKKISKYEDEYECEGLWTSLNFVKLVHVKKHCRKTKVDLKVNNQIIKDMVDRLDTDEEFAKRQKAISFAAKLSKKIGLLNLFNIPFVQNYMPYMMLEFSGIDS